jgi:NAD(P)-dependent dehydrogenase (short-subunit alcohol dehydrogenase family)
MLEDFFEILFLIKNSFLPSTLTMKTLLLFLLYWNLSEALSPRTVAVIGPTGRLGRQIVQELSTQGISTRCLLRHEIPASTSIKSLEEAQSSAEIAAYLQSLPNVTFVKGDLSDVSSLRRLLEGCDACVAAHGAPAPKPFWRSLILPNIFYSETLPQHPKQVNYQGLKNVLQVMNETSCKTIVRITGKGESPWSFFSILINALGALAKAWNYEGEQLLRSSGMDYIIIRPGVMKDSVEENTRYGLRDNGEDMKVTSVSYHQIAALAIQSLEYSNCRRATLTAMNDADGGETSYAPLLARVQPDRRVFPVSLLEEHRKAARVGGLTIVTVLVWMAQATVKVVLHLVGSF